MSRSLPSRGAALGILGLVTAAVALRLLGMEQAWRAALVTVLATMAIGVLPGTAVTLFWRPRVELTLLELIGFGIVLSFGIVQLLTILAVSAHVGPPVTLAILLGATALVAALSIRRPPAPIVVTMDETIVLILVAGLAWTLYLVGAPVDSAEDQIHAAIARRLSQLSAPGFENVYVTPGIVYTYPFPGTHYFMALISRLGEIDTLFLYHKIRFFWGVTALLMIYLCSRAVFGTASVAAAVAITAVVLVWNGVYALGFPTGWGQLVAFSHASDIAMSVLLPCLLAAAFWYVRAETARERSFFLLGTILLLLMLTMVHMREVVQFAAYIGCFTLVAALFRPLRPYVRRGAGLLGATLAIAAIYTLWQAWMVPLVDNIVDTQRAELLALAAQHSLPELLLTPASSIFPDSLQKFDQIFITLLPVFLFGGPVVIVVFRRQPLVWLLAATIVAYLLVMSVPLLAIPYIYLTYFEILHLPVRNIIFFVYLLGGALLYITVVALARVDRTRLSPLVVGALGGVVAILVTLCINRSHAGFFLPLIAAYGLTFFFASRAQGVGARVRARTAAAMVVSAIALAALWPDHAPEPRSEQVTIRWSPEVTTEQRTALEKRLSLQRPQARTDTDERNVWNYRLTDLTVGNVRQIVSEPAVADTHFIDRSTFQVESQPPLGDYLPWGVLHVRWVQYPNALVLALMAVTVWAIAFVAPGLMWLAGTAPARPLETALHEPFVRYGLAFALFLMPFALWSVYPTVSTLRTALMRERQWDTPRTMIAGLPCVRAPRMEARFTEHLFEDEQIMLPERTTCAPPYEVVQWMQDNLPADGVIGIDRWDPYPPVMFSPQQAVVFPTLEASFIREDTLFDEYYRLFYARMRQYRVQPFFNTEETLEQRDEYVDALGVTHVLVNPAHYDSLRPVLDALPDRFALKHAYDRWAIYQVIRS